MPSVLISNKATVVGFISVYFTKIFLSQKCPWNDFSVGICERWLFFSYRWSNVFKLHSWIMGSWRSYFWVINVFVQHLCFIHKEACQHRKIKYSPLTNYTDSFLTVWAKLPELSVHFCITCMITMYVKIRYQHVASYPSNRSSVSKWIICACSHGNYACNSEKLAGSPLVQSDPSFSTFLNLPIIEVLASSLNNYLLLNLPLNSASPQLGLQGDGN